MRGYQFRFSSASVVLWAMVFSSTAADEITPTGVPKLWGEKSRQRQQNPKPAAAGSAQQTPPTLKALFKRACVNMHLHTSSKFSSTPMVVLTPFASSSLDSSSRLRFCTSSSRPYIYIYVKTSSRRGKNKKKGREEMKLERQQLVRESVYISMHA